MTLMIEEEDHEAKNCKWPLEARKSKKRDSPPLLPEKNTAMQYLASFILTQ